MIPSSTFVIACCNDRSLKRSPFLLYPQRDEMPDEPGVYIFSDSQDRALYVGASKNLRQRWQLHSIQNLYKGDLNTCRLRYSKFPVERIYLVESWMINQLNPPFNTSRPTPKDPFEFARIISCYAASYGSLKSSTVMARRMKDVTTNILDGIVSGIDEAENYLTMCTEEIEALSHQYMEL